MIHIKPGASIKGLRPEALFGVRIAEAVYDEAGAPFVITSGTDGKHMEGSLHYQGLAFDCRLPAGILGFVPDFVATLRVALGDEFDVVLEKTHIHVEYDP